jgi:RNA-directed DNA polymerase
MTTGLERIAVKAQQDKKLQFTSLAHHITKELIWDSLNHMPRSTSPGIDGTTRDMATIDFENWVGEMMNSIHRHSYKPPAVRRVWIPQTWESRKTTNWSTFGSR